MLIRRLFASSLSLFVYVCVKFHHLLANHIKSRRIASKSLDLTYYLYECDQRQLEVENRTDNIIGIRDPSRGIFYNFLKSYTDFDGIASLRLAANKVYCYQLLESLKLPIPRHIIVNRHELAKVISFKKECPSGIVIKPGRDTGDGVGVFIKPDSIREIIHAVAFSSIFSKDILVEEFYEGTNYRLLYCDGAFIAASSRLPATVIGDVHSSISELIKAANRGRRKIGDIGAYSPETRPILFEIPLNKDVLSALKKQHLGFTSIPKSGQAVRLQHICHWLWGGAYEDVTDEVCHNLVKDAEKAVKSLGVRLAGVDVITCNIRDCTHLNYVINEINTTPALLVHYEVQNRQKFRPVAGVILDKLFKRYMQ